ncbi:MAG: hypothetical protein AAGJ93_14740, partial [Bacteroidota bacterium]
GKCKTCCMSSMNFSKKLSWLSYLFFIISVSFGDYQLNSALPFDVPTILLAGPLLILPMTWIVLEKTTPQNELIGRVCQS